MFKPGICQGRFLGETEIAQVRGLIVEHPQWHRRRISQELARLWDWRSPSGQLKDMAVRTLLLKLHGAQCFARIRSYLSTCRKHGINLWDACFQAATGQPLMPPSLLSHQAT